MRLAAIVAATFFIAGCCCLDRSWSEPVRSLTGRQALFAHKTSALGEGAKTRLPMVGID